MNAIPEPVRPVAQLDHVVLATRNVEKLRDFYHQHLGAAPVAHPEHTGSPVCALDFLGVCLDLVESHAEDGGASAREYLSQGFVELGFALGSAEAVDALTARLAADGHQVVEPPHRTCAGGCYESVVCDPDGNRLTLTV